MPRRLLLCLVVFPALALALPAAADGPRSEARWSLLSRNLKLIETLVDGGIDLAREPDRLKRADRCNAVARRLKDEIEKAAMAREGARAAELSDHFYDLLERGISENLEAARRVIPRGSAEEQTMRKVGGRAADSSRVLEEQLEDSARDDQLDLRYALKRIQAARSHVEKVLKQLGSGPRAAADVPPPPAGLERPTLLRDTAPSR